MVQTVVFHQSNWYAREHEGVGMREVKKDRKRDEGRGRQGARRQNMIKPVLVLQIEQIKKQRSKQKKPASTAAEQRPAAKL